MRRRRVQCRLDEYVLAGVCRGGLGAVEATGAQAVGLALTTWIFIRL